MPIVSQDLLNFLPEICLIGTGCLLLLLEPFSPPSRKSWIGIFSVIGILASAGATLFLWNRQTYFFHDLYILDPYSLFFKLIFLGCALWVFLVSGRYIQLAGLPKGEYSALVLFATAGMMVMSSGADLLSIYLGLEIMAIASYALVGFLKKDRSSLEGALKYFLLGAFNSGIILYGIALLYGVLGGTHLSEISAFLRLSDPFPKMFLIGMALLVCGFAFKIAAFPFHMWAPDVYEGSPAPIAGFISVGSKTAAFAALIRILFPSFSFLGLPWHRFFALLAILTMTVGNLLALHQENLKRMLAYSSIAHAGYLLIGLAVGSLRGISGMLFYFVAYLTMNCGAFAMIVLLARKDKRPETIKDFEGMSKHHPVWSLCFLIFLLSLAGIPPTGGFTAKFYLFAAAIEGRYYFLAIFAVLNSVLALAYYFRVVKALYFTEGAGSELSPSWGLRLSLILLALLSLLVGLFPSPLLQTVQKASSALL